jgi:hypothetical protein
MRSFVATLAVIAACLCTIPAQTKEDLHSGNYMLPLCEAWLGIKDVDSLQKEIERGDASTGGAPMHLMEMGRCAGEVMGVAGMLTMSNAGSFPACVPAEATPAQLISVVVTTLKQNPAHLHENFQLLAVAAMANAWPCPK